MFDLPSKRDIEIVSLELLKESHALDTFPTPVNEIVRCANINVSNEVDLSSLHHSFISKMAEDLANSYKAAIGMVRGLIDRREKIIYLDLKQQQSRQNFVTLHEVGHDVLPWQKAILDHLDDDETLDASTNKEFEAEANYFASTTLFQQDRFLHEMAKLQLGIKAPMQLAKHFGSSNHAALRKYVESSKDRCALLVLEKVSKKGEQPICYKKDFFTSQLFVQTFGSIQLPLSFGYKWAFCQDYYHKKKFHEKGQITLSTENGEADFSYHFFDTNYNAFVFLFPIGESKPTKTKIILSGV